MVRNYKKIILYARPDKYEELKEKLAGLPVSVWFRKKIDEELESKKEVVK